MNVAALKGTYQTMDLLTLRKIHYGMYIVASAHAHARNGQIANTVFQISAEPPTIAISINKANYTHEIISAAAVFTVSMLGESATMPFIGTFGFKSGRTIDKFKDVTSRVGVTGAPIVIDHAVGYVEAKVIRTVDVITHTLFIGEIVAAEQLAAGTPMTYAYYHEVKGGLTQKNAPTYIKPQ